MRVGTPSVTNWNQINSFESHKYLSFLLISRVQKEHNAWLRQSLKESQAAVQQSKMDAAILRKAVEAIVMVFKGGKVEEDGSYRPNLGALSPTVSPIPVITVSESNSEATGEVDTSEMEAPVSS